MNFGDFFVKKPKSNLFDLSHEKKLTGAMGQLIPIFTEECLPGDKWNINSEVLVRLIPTLAPIMHRINVYVHYFYVPYRLIWKDYEDFFTGGRRGDDDTIPPHILFKAGAIKQGEDWACMPGSLSDYLGVSFPMEKRGSGVSGGDSDCPYRFVNRNHDVAVSLLPYRAYARIWYDYYRDQNLIDVNDDWIVADRMISSGQLPMDSFLISGSASLSNMRRRAWQHDYFTSSLPFTQKGEELRLPFGISDADFSANVNVDGDTIFEHLHTGGNDDELGQLKIRDGFLTVDPPYSDFNRDDVYLKSMGRVSGKLTDINGKPITVNDLRRSVALQRWLEKNARGGSRYVETLLSNFGVSTKDARLDRVEYIGGGSQPVTVSEVLQLAETENSPLGAMGGHGISFGATGNKSYYCSEHGILMGIMSIMPRTGYMQGTRRHFLKMNRFDYYWPDLANIGEQPVFTDELYTAGAMSDDENIFGYMPRYQEYRFIPDSVHGLFKSDLEYWHMARKFKNVPKLNQRFVECLPTNRIFVYGKDDYTSQYLYPMHTCYIQMYNKVKAIRKVAKYSNPI